MTALSFGMVAGSNSQRRWTAFALAAGIEVLVAVLVLGWLAQQSVLPAPHVIPLSLEALLAPAPVNPPLPEVPRVVATTDASTKPQPAMPVRVAPMPVSPTAPTSSEIVEAVQTPAPPTPALVKPSTSAPAPHSAVPARLELVDPLIAYSAKLAAAAQAAFQVPAAAKETNFKGRSRVEFTLRDGVVSGVQISHSSGFGLVDRAALKAIQSATYPQPPESLQGKEQRYQIWVECY